MASDEDTKDGANIRRVDAAKARKSFREVVDEAYAFGRRMIVTRHGKEVAALVSMRDLDILKDRDAEADARMLERLSAADDGGQPDIPLGNVIAAVQNARFAEFDATTGKLRLKPVPAGEVASATVEEALRSPEFQQAVKDHVHALILAVAGEEVPGQEVAACKAGLLDILVRSYTEHQAYA